MSEKLLQHEAIEQDAGHPLSTAEVVALLALAIGVGDLTKVLLIAAGRCT